jgi:hypothetical protein
MATGVDDVACPADDVPLPVDDVMGPLPDPAGGGEVGPGPPAPLLLPGDSAPGLVDTDDPTLLGIGPASPAFDDP